jgi:RNA ligase
MECRGLIFDERGKVLSRRFHKFFNVNELEETNENVIDLSRPHILTEKIDGSLFTPFYTKGRLRWGSKLGVTEMTSQVEDRFLPNCGIDYNTFSAEWLAKEWTPIFEWCSLENQVVIRYPVSQLVLIALRHHITGEYMKYSEMANAAKKYNIPVVPTSSLSDGVKSTGELLAKVKKLENMEGFVLMFENGEMYKMKCDWYVQIAGMSSAQEKDFFLLILEKRLDDMGDSFGKERLEKLEDFGMKLMEVIEKNARRVNEIVADAKRRGLSKKEFAQEMKNLAAANKGKLECHTDIFFKVFEGKDAFQLIVDTLKKNCLTNAKLNKVRDSLAGGLSIKL